MLLLKNRMKFRVKKIIPAAGAPQFIFLQATESNLFRASLAKLKMRTQCY